jgi:hypothetical protein
LAPFLFKLGDYLAVFVELNTDEFGNVKQLPDVCFESEDESDHGSAADEYDESKEEANPIEETKDEQPVITEQPVQINTC